MVGVSDAVFAQAEAKTAAAEANSQWFAARQAGVVFSCLFPPAAATVAISPRFQKEIAKEEQGESEFEPYPREFTLRSPFTAECTAVPPSSQLFCFVPFSWHFLTAPGVRLLLLILPAAASC